MCEKELLEAAAASIFCSCLQKETGVHARFLRHNNVPKPDTTCTIQDTEIDLEIAHLYGTEIDAQNSLNRARRTPLSKQTTINNSTKTLTERALCSLNYILENKSSKKYDSACTWLVIRNVFHPWSKNDFAQHYSEIYIPKNHPFEKIWLICDPRGETGLIELCI